MKPDDRPCILWNPRVARRGVGLLIADESVATTGGDATHWLGRVAAVAFHAGGEAVVATAGAVPGEKRTKKKKSDRGNNERAAFFSRTRRYVMNTELLLTK